MLTRIRYEQQKHNLKEQESEQEKWKVYIGTANVSLRSSKVLSSETQLKVNKN